MLRKKYQLLGLFCSACWVWVFFSCWVLLVCFYLCPCPETATSDCELRSELAVWILPRLHLSSFLNSNKTVPVLILFTCLGICITMPGLQRHLTLTAHDFSSPSVCKYKHETESSKFLCTQDFTSSISATESPRDVPTLCVLWVLVKIHLGFPGYKGSASAGFTNLCWAVWVQKFSSMGWGKWD